MRYWPLFDLRLHTPRLELRIPGLADLEELADLAAEGVHDPAEMPFGIPWTDAPPEERARGTIQFHWKAWAEWTPDSWKCNFVAVLDGEVVATQGLMGKDFPVLREIGTGSWVGRRHQGKGIGTEMRAAVLHLAFAGLGATQATSSAFTDNPASLAVSRKLGYEPDGVSHHVRRGAPAEQIRLRLSRARWSEVDRPAVTITGLAPCLPLFGLRSDTALDETAPSADPDEWEYDENGNIHVIGTDITIPARTGGRPPGLPPAHGAPPRTASPGANHSRKPLN